MQNTIIPAALIHASNFNQKTIVKTDNKLHHFSENETTHFSRLYSLFFGRDVQVLKQPDTQAAATDPDEYSSYE